MEALFAIIKNQMKKHRVEVYHTDTVLLEVAAGSVGTIQANNDFHFFANAFTDGGSTTGKIRGTAGGNALNIDAATLSMELHKFQMFKGEVRITNNSTTNALFVELLRITPIPQTKK